jgi:hypothetical protein
MEFWGIGNEQIFESLFAWNVPLITRKLLHIREIKSDNVIGQLFS